MPRAAEMIGQSAAQRTGLVGIVSGTTTTGLTATGTTRADALPVNASVAIFTTVAASTGAILPADASPGDRIVIVNYGANTLTVYPGISGSNLASVTSATGATSVAHASNTTRTYLCVDGTVWIATAAGTL